jgi:hypothetical protein
MPHELLGEPLRTHLSSTYARFERHISSTPPAICLGALAVVAPAQGLMALQVINLVITVGIGFHRRPLEGEQTDDTGSAAVV